MKADLNFLGLNWVETLRKSILTPILVVCRPPLVPMVLTTDDADDADGANGADGADGADGAYGADVPGG